MSNRHLSPASYCIDAHSRPGLTSRSSVDSPRVGCDSSDTVVALLSYNVGIQNQEVAGSKWKNENGKYNKLKKDVQNTFAHETGIQILCISEFGHMFHKMSNAEAVFKTLLADLQITHLHLEIKAPYVALIDKTAWQVKQSELMTKLCDQKDICVHHLVLQHVDSRALFRIFNVHIPSSVGTTARKHAVVKTLCRTITSSQGSVFAQPTAKIPYIHLAQSTAAIPWAIVGDLNVQASTMLMWCQPVIRKGVPCISTSGWPHSQDPQKSDIAISQGITLSERKSWIGWHSRPCASDIHDAVVVLGTLHQNTRKGDTYPAANWATPRANAEGIDSFQGKQKNGLMKLLRRL